MNEEQLIELLSVYRHKGAMPSVGAGASAGTRRLESRRPHKLWWIAIAAAVVIAVIAVWPRDRNGWVTSDGRLLRAGDTIAAPTRLESRQIGVVEVGPQTIVRLEGRNRLALAHGTIHAKTISPPGLFIVDTPRARATDLGCEYVLSIAPNDGGSLRVLTGWVSLTRDGTQSLVPQGAKAIIGANGSLSAPIFEDAVPAFQQAVLRGDVKAALPLARRRDALTLINLFRGASAEERLQIYDRLNQLVSAPASAPRDAFGANWRIGAADPWWADVLKASGANAIKKKKKIGILPPM